MSCLDPRAAVPCLALAAGLCSFPLLPTGAGEPDRDLRGGEPACVALIVDGMMKSRSGAT